MSHGVVVGSGRPGANGAGGGGGGGEEMKPVKEVYPSYVTKATRRDLEQVFSLVNAAYKVEIGDDGIAYKNCNKYLLKDQTRKQLGDMMLLRDHRRLLGCCCAVPHKGVIEVIILAVHPDYQGNGYGAKLMAAVEAKAKEKVTLGVPSCREDVIPFFEKRGYRRVLSKPLEEMRKLYPEELNEKTLTREDIEWTMLVKKMDNDDDDDEAVNFNRE